MLNDNNARINVNPVGGEAGTKYKGDLKKRLEKQSNSTLPSTKTFSIPFYQVGCPKSYCFMRPNMVVIVTTKLKPCRLGHVVCQSCFPVHWCP
jgi:hypothetical protein